MKFYTKFVSLLVSFFLVLPILVIAVPTAELDHKIAGYGAVKGDLYAPISSCIYKNQLYVLDNFGISIYDLSSKQLLKQFNYPYLPMNNAQIWNDPKTWADFISSFSNGILGLAEGLFMGSGGLGSLGSTGANYIKPDLYFDSAGRLFLVSNKGIQELDPSDGALISTVAIPEATPSNPEEETSVTIVSKLINDKLYMLQAVSTLESFLDPGKHSIVIMGLDGKIEKQIDLTIENEDITVLPSDFIYLPDLDVFGLIAIELFSLEPTLPFLFFDHEGKAIPCSGKDLKVVPTGIAFQKPDKVILSGMTMGSGLDFSGSTSLLTLSYKQNEEGIIEFKSEKKLPHKNFGMSAIDLFVNDTEISMITAGTMETPIWEARLFYIHGDKVVDRIGNSLYGESKVFGSIAFAVDQEGNLFETSFTNSLINKYDKNGNYLSSIEIDLETTSSLMGILTIFPTVLDMVINGDYLYLNNLLPGTICRYSFIDESWEQLFAEDFLESMDSFNLVFNMKIEDDTLFMLDSSKLIDGAPNFFFLDENLEYSSINLEDSPAYDSEHPPIFMCFSMTDTEYLFLDSIGQNIWKYDRLNRKYTDQVSLPKNPQGFYTSFDLYPDESFIVSDVISGELLHISPSGELLEKIGKKGKVAIGKTKEAYMENKDQFNMPVRVKVANKQLYVSDLLNCRYHLIPIEKQPSIEWEKDSINISSFSVFGEENIDINFIVTPKIDFDLSISASEPWLQVPSETVKSTAGKISFKVLGKQLNCWKANEGMIKISCPSYPELSKELHITVNAVGNIVEVTIGSNKAKLNGKEVLIDQASIPSIVNGRTFVGIRFMGEIVFNNLAKINYDAKSQTVFFELGSKKIELYIGKNYALVNGNKVTLDVPPFISNGRTFVPLRFVSENLDASVSYDSKTQTITIMYPGK
jgi:hypothetical protein